MPKGKLNKRYTGEFKQQVVEYMRDHKLSHREAERKFELPDKRAASWERIYLEEGVEGLYAERRGHANAASGIIKGRKPVLSKQVEEDLIAEVQRLRAENAYLKKLKALVQEEELRERKHK